MPAVSSSGGLTRARSGSDSARQNRGSRPPCAKGLLARGRARVRRHRALRFQGASHCNDQPARRLAHDQAGRGATREGRFSNRRPRPSAAAEVPRPLTPLLEARSPRPRPPHSRRSRVRHGNGQRGRVSKSWSRWLVTIDDGAGSVRRRTPDEHEAPLGYAHNGARPCRIHRDGPCGKLSACRRSGTCANGSGSV
jgi:hypothetical protein